MGAAVNPQYRPSFAVPKDPVDQCFGVAAT
jgi:hypothetical protein